MVTVIENTLRRINSSDKPLNILTFITHEGYASMLGHIPNVTFHVVHLPGGKLWDFHTRGLPPNHVLHLANPEKLGSDIKFDAILSQERAGQLPIALSLGRTLGIPVISLNHTEPYPHISSRQKEKLCQLKGDYNVYITEYNRNSWNDSKTGIVINHGIDTTLFTGGPNLSSSDGVVIANSYRGRDVFLGFKLYDEVCKTHLINVIGENKEETDKKFLGSINVPAKLVSTISQHRYAANFTQLSPLPMSLLEMAAIGMPIITTDKQQIGEVFKNNQNALIANTVDEFNAAITTLKNDPGLCIELGQNARKTIETQFSINKFVQSWQALFRKLL